MSFLKVYGKASGVSLDLSVKVEDLFVQTGFLLISFYLG